jgi:hypothetical protein
MACDVTEIQYIILLCDMHRQQLLLLLLVDVPQS